MGGVVSDQHEKFLSEGMGRFKAASATMHGFRKEMEQRLQTILQARAQQGFGSFVPVPGQKPRSTRYWAEYPLFNARITGALGQLSLRLSLVVNWSSAEGDYPFYAVWLEAPDPPRHPCLDEGDAFSWIDGVEWVDDWIRFQPDPDDFNLERDFGRLLDEAVRFMSAHASG